MAVAIVLAVLLFALLAFWLEIFPVEVTSLAVVAALAAASIDALALARPGLRGFALVLGAINLVPCALAAGWGGAAPLALAFALHVLAWRGAAWTARAAPADAPALPRARRSL